MMVRLSLICCLLCLQCQSKPLEELKILKGSALGTYYAISYVSDQSEADIKIALDNIFEEVNQSLSTYRDTSLITNFNKSTEGIRIAYKDTSLPVYTHFLFNLRSSQQLSTITQGYFDPSLMPLINYWGFSKNKYILKEIDSLKIKSLIGLKGMDHFNYVMDEDSLWVQKRPGQQLDFNASAKGYTVDEVGRMLESKGIYNYLVDIGGEQRIRGVKSPDRPWRIAINVPAIDASPYDTIRSFNPGNSSIATSGNYRNFYEIEGVNWGHTINPFTGFAKKVDSPLLSASILHSECMVADAWATACMAMGLDKAKEILAQHQITACLIFLNDEGELELYYSGGMESLFN